MADNLIQKIMSGKYTNTELNEIEDAILYAKQVYGITKTSILNAEADVRKKEKIQEIDHKITELKSNLVKRNKKQQKYILAMFCTCLPIVCMLCVASAFNIAFLSTGIALSIGTVALGAVPIGIMDIKIKNTLKEIDMLEKERAKVLSDICFTIKQDYATNAYNDYRHEIANYREKEKTDEESLSI